MKCLTTNKMTLLVAIKNEINELYIINSNIHINVALARTKVYLQNKPIVLKDVYIS